MKYTISAILIAAFAGSAQAQPAKIEAEKPVTVPFTLVSTGHFIVKVKLNDKGPYNLIFDTGAPLMLITNRAGRDSGILDKKSTSNILSPFGPMTQAKIKKMEIGPLKAEDVNAMVFDHPTVKAFSEFFKKDYGEIDGIVGFPFFAKYRMTVDYKAKELTFTPNGYVPTDVMQRMMNMLLKQDPDKGKPKIVAAAGQWGIIVEKEMKDEDAGVTIKTVMDSSAADKAGLKAGDRLLTIDGRWTDSVGDAYQAAGYVKPGKSAPVVIKRDGKEMKLTVTPANGL
jgi:PDZ domain/Aspartyl protease